MEQTSISVQGQDPGLKGRWMKLDTSRSNVLLRARKCSELTIPALLPPLGSTQNTTLPTPFQSVGAWGTNNVASKILLTLFPPNTPLFKLAMDDFTIAELAQNPDARAEVELGLNKIERAVTTEIETLALRVPIFEALKHLVVTGNVLIYIDDTGKMKIYRLDQFVIKRDPMGKVLELLTREEIHPVSLDEEVRARVQANMADPDATVELFTQIKLDDKGKLWEVRQEVKGVDVPSSSGSYPAEDCPWIPLRWNATAGEDYGRGHVEQYLGDLESLEALMEAIVEGSAASAKLLFMVNPNGTTRIKKIAKARSGDIIEGVAEDVTVLQCQKSADLQVAQVTAQAIEQRLSQAFLLMSAIQRDAERVTAEEIRNMVKELEEALGGVYSVLSQELQLPLVRRVMNLMSKKKKLPKLPKKIVRPIIVTGIEALGRGNDLNKLIILLQQLQPFPDAMQYVNMANLIKRIATALGIDIGGLIYNDQQMQQMQQDQAMSQMGQAAVPGVAREVAKGMMQPDGQSQPTE